MSENLSNITNYRRFSERVSTAGQPSEEQFKTVSESGFEVIINLGVLESRYALPNEEEVVKALGLNYIHIPVSWEQPQKSDLEAFLKAMEANKDKKVFVHCAMNMRVSVFTALYGIAAQHWSEEQAQDWIKNVWEPNPTWQTFFNDQVTRHHDS